MHTEFWIGNLRGKRQLGRSRLVEENNIKMGMIKYGMA
jgi:hypothetical protein